MTGINQDRPKQRGMSHPPAHEQHKHLTARQSVILTAETDSATLSRCLSFQAVKEKLNFYKQKWSRNRRAFQAEWAKTER